MPATRPPAYIVILWILSAGMLIAGMFGGLLSMGHFSSPTTKITALAGGIGGTVLACVTAWMNDVIQALAAPPTHRTPSTSQQTKSLTHPRHND